MIVSDVASNRKWHFLCNCWLAVDLGDCERDRVFIPVSKKELFAFGIVGKWWCFTGLRGSVFILSFRLYNLFLFFNKILFKDFIYLFLERGEGRGKEREKNINVREKHRSVVSHTCPDQESTWRPFALPDKCPPNWATAVRARLYNLNWPV